MAEATNAQMQAFGDNRLRPYAELLRDIRVKGADHRAVIDDIYARGVGSSRWNDARTDGPAHLLQSGNSANPDDMLNFNTALVMVEKFFSGTFADVNEANSFAANWAVLQDACVRGL